MKHILLFFAILSQTTLLAQIGGVGIGTSTPDSNAILELKSANKTLLLPRLANSTLTHLTGKEGMIAYDEDKHEFSGYVGSAPILVTNNIGNAMTAMNELPGYVMQTYTAPHTFMLHDVRIFVTNSNYPSPVTMNIYSGTGVTGTLLGTRNVVVPPNTSYGQVYINFASDEIKFTQGNVYTIQIIGGLTFHCTGNTYNGGILSFQDWDLPQNDLSFQVYSVGPQQWTTLTTQTSIANSGLLLPSIGGTPSALNHYEEATFTVTFSNGSNNYASNYTVKAVRVGKQVTITFPTDLINLNITGVQVVAVQPLPARFVPQTSLYHPIPLRSNGVYSIGLAHITSSGIGLYSGSLGAPFSGPNSGIRACSITYSVQ